MCVSACVSTYMIVNVSTFFSYSHGSHVSIDHVSASESCKLVSSNERP